jgi:hypothetical protein
MAEVEPENGPRDEPLTWDLGKWIAQKEDREHAIRVLMPEDDVQSKLRRPYITKVNGPIPSMQLVVRSQYHIERLRARMEKRPVRQEVYEVVDDLLDLAQSVKGWRADKIVEAHTGTPKQVSHRTWADVILGRK